MRLIETRLDEVKIIEPRVFEDDRGFFMEVWNERTYAAMGIAMSFVQDNHSRSRKGVLRGLHYQVVKPQGKLVRVTAGRAFDVAVDIRRSSSQFGQWVGVELSAENRRQLWIPPGFAHGFLAMEEGTDFQYKCTDFYAAEHERTLLWSDSDLKINWPLSEISGGQPIVTVKDAEGLGLVDAEFDG